MSLGNSRHERLRAELRAARVRAKLRQVDVAEHLGRPQSYVAKIERGERRIDVIETLELCAVLGLDPHALIDAIW